MAIGVPWSAVGLLSAASGLLGVDHLPGSGDIVANNSGCGFFEKRFVQQAEKILDNFCEKTLLVDEKIITLPAERQKVQAEKRSHRPDCRTGINLALQYFYPDVQMVPDNVVVAVYCLSLDPGFAEFPFKKQARTGAESSVDNFYARLSQISDVLYVAWVSRRQ